MPPFRPRQFSQGSDAEWDQVLAHPHVQQALQDPQISNALGHVLQQNLGIPPQGYADGGSVGIPDPQTVSKFQQLQEELRDEYEPTKYQAGGGVPSTPLTMGDYLRMGAQPGGQERLRDLWRDPKTTTAERTQIEQAMAALDPTAGAKVSGLGSTGLGRLGVGPNGEIIPENSLNRNASLILGGMMGLGVQGNISPMARIASALLGAGMAWAGNKWGRGALIKAREQRKLAEAQQQRADQATGTHEPQLADKSTQQPTPPPAPPPAPPPPQPDRLPQIPTIGGAATATPPATASVATPNNVNNTQNLASAANQNLPPPSFGAAPGRTPREQSGLGLYSEYDPSKGGGEAAGLSSTQSGPGHWSGYEPKTGRQIESTDGTNWTYAGTSTPYSGNTVFQKTQDWGPSGSAPATAATTASQPPAAVAPASQSPANLTAFSSTTAPQAPPRTWAQAIELARKNREESIAQGNYGFVPRPGENALDRTMQKQYGIEEAATGTLPSQLQLPGEVPGAPYPGEWSTEIPGAALAAAEEGYYARGGPVHGDAAQDRQQMLGILKEKKLIKKARGGFASGAADEALPSPPLKKGKSPLLRKPPKRAVPAIAIIITASKKPPGKEGGRKKAKGGKIVLAESQLDKSARKPRAVPPVHGPGNGDQYAPYKKGGHVQVPRGSGAAVKGKRFSGIY